MRALSPRTWVLGISCGISPPFGGLSPISGQVSHILLTRPPCADTRYCYRALRTRLACVRHAASVRSEPGSNSRLNLVALKIKKPDLPCETPDPDLQCELFVARFTHSNRTGSGMSSDCQRAGPPVQQLGVQAIRKYSHPHSPCQPYSPSRSRTHTCALSELQKSSTLYSTAESEEQEQVAFQVARDEEVFSNVLMTILTQPHGDGRIGK